MNNAPPQSQLDNIRNLVQYLTPELKAELDELLTAGAPIWSPLPGPQTLAYESEADVIGYGGAAGGGKSDLMCGYVLTKHTKSAIFRRESTELPGIIDRLEAILGNKDGFNGSNKIWRLGAGRQILFGSCPHPGDESKYQGSPKDFLGLDEATRFLESQVRYLMGWVRTTNPHQRCRTLMTFNPPRDAEGQWVIQYFAPWLVEEHPRPAVPGELRWFATIDGKDKELEDGTPFMHGSERITPTSRTFIPSNINDNPYLVATGYVAQLQSLPEPLRSQMLKGDFKAGLEDDQWQVIPTAWVQAAQARWVRRDAKGVMDSVGADIARGGSDKTILARRHGTWFDELIELPAIESQYGDLVAGQILAYRRDLSPIHIDVAGVGGSPFDFLRTNQIQVVPINNANKTHERTADGQLEFVNMRAKCWWRMREALDPMNPYPISLPPDPALRADLCAPKWSLRASGIQIEGKPEVHKRIGRSPDRGDAVVLANIITLKDSIRRPRRVLSGIV